MRTKKSKKSVYRIPAMVLVCAFSIAGVGGFIIKSHSSSAAAEDIAYARPLVSSDTSSATTASAASKTTPTPATTTSPSTAVGTTVASSVATTKTTTTTTHLATTTITAISAAPALSRTLQLYANPNADVATEARAWAAQYPGDAAMMEQLANTPMAQWFGDFSGDIGTAVNTYVTAATAAGQIPVLVAYNIPERDCGGDSSGGAASAAAYETWINQFGAAIGERSAIVIVEPDALADMDCLSASDQQTREQLLSYAIQTLHAGTKAAIYLDAGNSSWQPVATMTSRLQASGIAAATGFSLNVSNFDTTASNTSYGTQLSAAVGGKHFVIDTSRNGNGPAATAAGSWCNPDGRAFGTAPTLATGNNLIDGYLWIKDAGESDGACGPDQAGTTAPAAGIWWPQYALMLEQNSGW